MTRGKIMSHRMISRRRIVWTLPAIVAANFVVAGVASAQQPAPAAKPAVPKPAAQKPSAAATPAPAAPSVPGAPQPTLLGQFGDWGAYAATPGGRKVCFALAKPANSSTSPPNRPRDPTYIFISSRPAEKVRDEVSIIFGYGLKPNADAISKLRVRTTPCTPRPTALG